MTGNAFARFVRPEGTAERELSQFAAGGMTEDVSDYFDAGLSGDALRIGTIRAPMRDFRRAFRTVFFGRMVAVLQHPDTMCLANFRLSRSDECAADHNIVELG